MMPVLDGTTKPTTKVNFTWVMMETGDLLTGLQKKMFHDEVWDWTECLACGIDQVYSSPTIHSSFIFGNK